MLQWTDEAEADGDGDGPASAPPCRLELVQEVESCAAHFVHLLLLSQLLLLLLLPRFLCRLLVDRLQRIIFPARTIPTFFFFFFYSNFVVV